MKVENLANSSADLSCEELEAIARRESTIVANRSLVYWLAKRFKVTDEVYQELVQTGLSTLCRAADDFNHDSDSRFATFAYHKIRSAMLQYLDNNCLESISHADEEIKQNIAWVDKVVEANQQVDNDEKIVIHSFMTQKIVVSRMRSRERFLLISRLVFSKLKLATLTLLPSRRWL